MDRDHTRTAANELDIISGELHLIYRAIHYLADKLTEASEERLEPTAPEFNNIKLTSCYRESYNIALMLADYTEKLREQEQRIDSIVHAMYLDTAE